MLKTKECCVVIMISKLVIILIFAPWLLGDVWWGIGMLLNELLNHAWHHIFKSSSFAIRPHHAFNCNIFNKGGWMGGKPGFPSGHMSHTGMFFAYALLKYCKTYWWPWLILGSILATLGMGFSRFSKHCHTLLQIFVGLIIGASIGAFWFFLQFYKIN